MLRVRSKKSLALLAYLAFFSGKTHEREKLQALLWPASRRSQAQASLRQALAELRKALPAPFRAALATDSFYAGLDTSRILVDVALLERCVAEGTREALGRIPSLCSAPFLHGFACGESSFDDWVRLERARLLEVTVVALDKLIALETSAGRLDRAIDTALHSLRLEPREERTHRVLMKLYMEQGRRSRALEQYERCVAVLRRELGVEPDSETQRIHRELLGAEAPSTQLPLSSRPSNPAAVGRDRELAELDRALEGSRASPPRLIGLLGEAGIGKTRLAEAVAERAMARGARCLRGRCFESEQVLSFSVWLDLLDGEPWLLDERFWGELHSAQRGELSRIVPGRRDVAAQSSRAPSDARALFEAVGALLTLAARGGPLFVVLEDLQWADSMSLRLLSFLARRLPPTSDIRFLSTLRIEDLGRSDLLQVILREVEEAGLSLTLELGPLSRAHTLDLFRSLSGAHDKGLLERVWSLSEGNPLVVVETARSLERGTIAPLDENLPVPDRVRELIDDRVARLTAEGCQLLATAAVIGRRFRFDLVSLAAGCGDRAGALLLEELVRARFLQTAHDVRDEYYFTHDRIREVVYAGLLPAHRSVLHRAVARALERLHATRLNDVLGAIGYHFAHAGDAAEAIAYLTRFAEQSEQAYGLEEAVGALGEAERQSALLPASERHAAAIDVATRRARCLFFLGRIEEMDAALEPHQAVLCEIDAPTLAASYYVYLAMAHTCLGNRRRVEEHESLLIPAAERCTDATIRGMAQAQLSYNAFRAGRFPRGIEYGVEAVATLDCGDDPEMTGIAWLNLGGNYMAMGDCRRAREAFSRAKAIGQRAFSPRVESMGLAFTGCLSVVAFGEIDAGLTLCRAGVRMAPDVHSTVHANVALIRACAIALFLSSDGADAALDDVFEHSVGVMTAIVSSGDSASSGWAGAAHLMLSEAALATADVAGAKAHAEQSLAVLRAEGDPLSTGWALRALGNAELMLGGLDAAAVRLGEALRLFERIDAKFDWGSTLLLTAAVSAAQQDSAAAASRLREAHELFCALELPLWTSFITRMSETLVPG